jgi:hypothetical protein
VLLGELGSESVRSPVEKNQTARAIYPNMKEIKAWNKSKTTGGCIESKKYMVQPHAFLFR